MRRTSKNLTYLVLWATIKFKLISTPAFTDILLTMFTGFNPNHPQSIKIHPPVLEDFGGFRIPPH